MNAPEMMTPAQVRINHAHRVKADAVRAERRRAARMAARANAGRLSAPLADAANARH